MRKDDFKKKMLRSLSLSPAADARHRLPQCAQPVRDGDIHMRTVLTRLQRYACALRIESVGCIERLYAYEAGMERKKK